MTPGAAQPLGEVGAQPNDDASIYHFSSSQFIICRSPRTSIKLAGVPYPFLLYTGAGLSVLPSCILSRPSPHFFCNTPHTRSVHGIAGRDAEITGPSGHCVWHDGVQLTHEFIKIGMPHGSVLGPLLFVMYTADLAPLIAEHRLHSHLYAYDTQVCGWCQPTDVSLLQDSMPRCIDDVCTWMCSNRL